MGKEKDIRKMMAVLSEGNKITLPFSVEQRDIEIPYIKQDGSIARRSIRIYLPETFPRPMPVVYVAHYEMKESDTLLRLYLLKGWAVATTIDFIAEYNRTLVDDDMIFNSAALTVVREQPDIDRARIAVTGGSAGGYMALMLSILHLGIRCSVSFSGVTNIPYLMNYFEDAEKFNAEERKKLTPEESKDFALLIERLPIPVLGAIYGQLSPIMDKMKVNPDEEYWKSLTPSCMTSCFSNPLLFTHVTSDALVPIDQLTSRYCYSELGDTLPANFKYGLSNLVEDEQLRRPLADALPPDDVYEVFVPAPENPNAPTDIPYDVTKKFNIVVYDEGVVEAYAGHNKRKKFGVISPTDYMEAQLTKRDASTNWLTADKLALMVERYKGTSLLLPGHAGIDDKLHGSKAMYQRIIVDELSEYSSEQSSAFNDACQHLKKKRPKLVDTLNEIIGQLK